ncbi:hypothetical protein AVEN_223302-1 [Araneus ventricosus]|uniref:Uncharacterized protein n=1 Tax=Araneus ventricosus TaxID=182803 RepID=A0A4Y2G913_ARAVE|nr:hypothetical protein AVEN_223302-1 [Araneus ventricosus]
MTSKNEAFAFELSVRELLLFFRLLLGDLFGLVLFIRNPTEFAIAVFENVTIVLSILIIAIRVYWSIYCSCFGYLLYHLRQEYDSMKAKFTAYVSRT